MLLVPFAAVVRAASGIPPHWFMGETTGVLPYPPPVTADAEELVRQGEAALAVCDWAGAQQAFEAAAVVAETPAVLDGLGQARYWQGDYAVALALRERAYAGYHAVGDHRRAALVACQLALLHWLIHGNTTAAGGWLRHAERMAAQAGDCREAAWVALYLADGCADHAERERLLEEVRAAARRHGDTGLEYDALAAIGRARLAGGQIAEGMALLDEAVAAAAGGLVDDPWATAEILCGLFDACETLTDVPRAQQWLAAVDGYVERTGELPVAGICRMHYGGILIAAGRWDAAEAELLAALEVYDATYRGTRHHPLARLADLRVRQGRLEEAARLLDGLEEHAEAAVPCVRLRLERGEAELALTAAERHLARRGRGVASAPLLAVLVQAALACGRPADAAAAAADLAALAEVCDLPSLAGLAALSQGRVAAGADEPQAARLLEEALGCFVAADLPWDLAVTRLELAGLLATTAPAVAAEEARAALEAFTALGAARHADAAAALLRRLGDRGRPTPRATGPLTRREAEVLDLLGEGLSNAQIAERLYISPRTAEHHVGNILSKLGLASRAEAAAYSLRHRLRP